MFLNNFMGICDGSEIDPLVPLEELLHIMIDPLPRGGGVGRDLQEGTTLIIVAGQ